MVAISTGAIGALSVDQLTSRLHELRREERHRLVELLRYLGELERRDVLPGLGFSGVFAFCTEYLGYTRSAAFRRTTAARLLARFPVVGDYLADGRLCLTALVELRDVLEEERLDEILSRAAGKTEDEVKRLVAALRPQPAPLDLLRRLPVRPASAAPASASAGPAPAVAPTPAPAPAAAPASATSASAGPAPAAATSATPAPASSPMRSTARLEPIDGERYVLRVTVDAAFVADLQALRVVLGHKLPGGGLSDLLQECVRQTLAAANRRRKGATRKPAAACAGGAAPKAPSATCVPNDATTRLDEATTTPNATAAASAPCAAPPLGAPRRAIPAAVRAAVWARDEHRCAYVSPAGRRCTSTHQLELHHLVPFARGGPDTVENVGLRCRVHNQHAAVQDFGRAHVEAARRRGGARRPARRCTGAAPS